MPTAECPRCLERHDVHRRCTRHPDEVRGERSRRLRADNDRLRAVLDAAGIRILADGTAWSHDGRLVYDPADETRE